MRKNVYVKVRDLEFLKPIEDTTEENFFILYREKRSVDGKKVIRTRDDKELGEIWAELQVALTAKKKELTDAKNAPTPEVTPDVTPSPKPVETEVAETSSTKATKPAK